MIKLLKRNHNQAGFTLIELVMTTVLIGIIAAIVGKTLFQGYQTFLVSQDINDGDWQGMLILNRIVQDIHQIRSAADIGTIQATQLSFTDITGSSVQYQLSGTTLLRNGQILGTDIQSFGFLYSDKDASITSTPASVRYIYISLTITSGSVPLSFSTLAGTRGMT